MTAAPLRDGRTRPRGSVRRSSEASPPRTLARDRRARRPLAGDASRGSPIATGTTSTYATTTAMRAIAAAAQVAEPSGLARAPDQNGRESEQRRARPARAGNRSSPRRARRPRARPRSRAPLLRGEDAEHGRESCPSPGGQPRIERAASAIRTASAPAAQQVVAGFCARLRRDERVDGACSATTAAAPENRSASSRADPRVRGEPRPEPSAAAGVRVHA